MVLYKYFIIIIIIIKWFDFRFFHNCQSGYLSRLGQSVEYIAGECHYMKSVNAFKGLDNRWFCQHGTEDEIQLHQNATTGLRKSFSFAVQAYDDDDDENN